ncbi:MAG: hypothetical protein Rubg2KO_35640 [Rubricoccaceae bacterium]
MRLLASSLIALALLASACAEPPASDPTPAPQVSSVPSAPPVPSEPLAARSPESIAAANAMWATFQDALRTRDRDALAALVADTLMPHVDRGDDMGVVRTTTEHAAVIDGLLSDDTRDALLAIAELEHTPRFSAASYAIPQDDGQLMVGYGFEEVAPGDWRLATLGTQWSR